MKRLFLFLIPFLFIACTPVDVTEMIVVKNKTDYEMVLYCPNAQEFKSYTIEPRSSKRLSIPEGLEIKPLYNYEDVSLDISRIPISGTSADCYTYYILEEYPHYVINNYKVKIIFLYDDKQVEIEPQDTYSYYSYNNNYMYYYIVGCELVKGKNKDITVR